jgi:hypothetical protein
VKGSQAKKYRQSPELKRHENRLSWSLQNKPALITPRHQPCEVYFGIREYICHFKPPILEMCYSSSRKLIQCVYAYKILSFYENENTLYRILYNLLVSTNIMNRSLDLNLSIVTKMFILGIE